MSLKNDIEKGLWDELSESAQKKAEKYLNSSLHGRGGKLRVTINEDAYAQARKDDGYFALVSNKAEDCFEALRKYRLREKIETNPSEPKYVHTKWGVGYYYYQK